MLPIQTAARPAVTLPRCVRSLIRSRPWMALACALLLGAANAHAESQLLLQLPHDMHNISAATFGTDGQRVGESEFEIENRDDGRIDLRIEIGIKGGARNRVEALLERVEGRDGEALRLLSERSQTFLPDGTTLPLLQVDHVKGVASCTETNGGAHKRAELSLDGDDRVVNVPLNLLFQPLVQGKVDELEFQIFTCSGGPKRHDVKAHRVEPIFENGRHKVVEIRYGPDFGVLLSRFAAPLMPRLSFWFDGDNGDYLGHRMPLYAKGPEVTLVREGYTPPQLGIQN